MSRCRILLPVAAVAAILGSAAPVYAQTIIDEWSSVQAPPAPELKAVTVDPKTTALLVLDLVTQTCNAQRRPRCLATLPAAKKLLAEARSKNLLVVYSYVPGGTLADALPEVAPTGKEPAVQAGADKFLDTNLEQILKDKGIQTVIVIGTAAHGAVLYTASEAAMRGFNVIVPVDGMSAENAYIEQYVAYNLTNAPGVSSKTTLTRIDTIKF